MLTFPKRLLHFSPNLRQKIAQHLAYRLNAGKNDVLPYIATETECWGKVKWIGGDMVHARELVEFCEGKNRDMSYVSVSIYPSTQVRFTP